MTKKILIVEGSPRKNGNSCVLAAEAAAAMREAGAEVETIHLHGMKIKPCTGCDGCMKPDVMCVLKDDMQELYPKLVAADGMILAAPIYWYSFCGEMKVFIDRWYALWNQKRDFLRGKPVGVILTFGDEDLYRSGGINAVHTFESIFRGLGANAAGWVFGSLNDVGEAQQHPELMEAARKLGSSVCKEL